MLRGDGDGEMPFIVYIKHYKLARSRAFHRELNSKIGSFVLRRTQELLAKHLPPLNTYNVFCQLSSTQVGAGDLCCQEPILNTCFATIV